MNKRTLTLVVIAVLACAGLAMACSKKTDTKPLENRIATVEAQQAAGATADQNAAMASALNALAAAGIHEFATSVDEGTLPPGEIGPIRIALAAISSVQWPAELQSDAQDMQTKLAALLDALGTDDIAQVKGPADDAHEANDSFPGNVYGYLAGTLGLPTPAADAGD